jgi:hypothetical protein
MARISRRVISQSCLTLAIPFLSANSAAFFPAISPKTASAGNRGP